MAESYSSVRFIKDFKICQEHTLLEVHKDLMNMSERKDEEIGRPLYVIPKGGGGRQLLHARSNSTSGRS